jgi:hypothetical protein
MPAAFSGTDVDLSSRPLHNHPSRWAGVKKKEWNILKKGKTARDNNNNRCWKRESEFKINKTTETHLLMDMMIPWGDGIKNKRNEK